jgi:hypothetical protein
MPHRIPLVTLALGAAVLATAPRSALAQTTTAPAPAPQAAPSTADDERAVLAVLTRLFDAMRARDTAAMRATFAPGASLASSSERDGRPVVQHDSLGRFLASIAAAPPGLLLDERLHGPQVRVSDGLATVWVEYDFYAGERFSHCGIDAVHLGRTADGWRIVHLMDTRRRTGCPTR